MVESNSIETDGAVLLSRRVYVPTPVSRVVYPCHKDEYHQPYKKRPYVSNSYFVYTHARYLTKKRVLSRTNVYLLIIKKIRRGLFLSPQARRSARARQVRSFLRAGARGARGASGGGGRWGGRRADSWGGRKQKSPPGDAGRVVLQSSR